MARRVVVDGSNLATEGRSLPSLAQLNDAVRSFGDEHAGDDVIVVVDASFGYRIDEGESRFCFATDNEIAMFANQDNGTLKDLANWCRDADLLVHDAQYSTEEYKTHAGFGHSTYEEALALAEQAGVKELAFFHHDPVHSDTDIDALIEEAMGNHRQSGGADLNAFPAAEEQELAL